MKYLLRGALLSVLLMVSGCGTLAEPDASAIGGEHVIGLSAAQVKDGLVAKGIVDEDATIFGYDAYKINYTTTDEEGNSVEVSGLMTVPNGMPEVVTETLGLSLVSDDHGTIFANREAPTSIAEFDNKTVSTPIIFTAMAGFITLQPDYIGFGDSNDHYHPFVLKKSLASTTIDFIKAAKKFAADNGIKLNGQLFLTGYSEGGYAALATLQKIEADGELTVTMAAPMAGPYDLNRTAMGVLSLTTLGVPSFMANVGYAYAKAYNKELSDVINEPYASKLVTLFSGDYNRTEIDPELTTVTTGATGLFNQTLVGGFFQDPDNSWFKQAMLENDVHKWGPKTPVILVHCMGDDVIPFGISLVAEGMMNAYHAVDVSVIPVEVALTKDPATLMRLKHGECGKYAYGIAAAKFGEARFDVFHY